MNDIPYYLPLFSRLEPRTAWTESRITETDVLTLEDAARFATKHAGTEVREGDFLRAAARGEIMLRAIVHVDAKVQRFDGGIYCNAGQPTENIIPKGGIPTLPNSACRQLANTGRASWRTIDGYDVIDGQSRRYEIARLTDAEPDYETTLDDCRVLGVDVHALADAFITAPGEIKTPSQTMERPIARQVFQERLILEWLSITYSNAMALPIVPLGKAGPKAAAWAELKKRRDVFQSKVVFDKAWDRLRANGEIG